jgi:hypothetical protein
MNFYTAVDYPAAGPTSSLLCKESIGQDAWTLAHQRQSGEFISLEWFGPTQFLYDSGFR